MRPFLVTALICGGALFAAESLASGPVYSVQECNHPRVRPTEIVFLCGDAGAYMQHIRWRRWGGSIAVGTGLYSEKTCVPSCAGGPIRRHQATIWLGNIGRCRGQGAKRFYRRAKVSGVRTQLPDLCPI